MTWWQILLVLVGAVVIFIVGGVLFNPCDPGYPESGNCYSWFELLKRKRR